MTDVSARRTRRRARVLVAAGAALVLAAGWVLAMPGVSAAAPLKSSSGSRVIGAAVTVAHIGETQYANTWTTEFNGFTAENEMKWDTTEPSRGQFSFGNADNLVSRAQAAGMKIRGHVLVWHSQLASWVNNVTSGTELLTVMRNHINGVATHFAGKIQYWDVVNEAFEENGSRRQSIFQQRIGNSYVEEAFRAARAADPAAKLCYNDYNTDGQNAKSNAVFAMVQDFKQRGVPIDCVGFQSHMIVGQVPGDYQANLQRFANLGVDVNITELDIRTTTPATAAVLQTQANNYSTVVRACVAIARCTSITVWGITDRYSWVPDVFPGQGAALLFDENYNKKPAYNAVDAALGGGPTGGPTTPTGGPTTPTGGPTSPTGGPPGACRVTYQMNAWNTGFTTNIVIANTSGSTINGWSLVFTLPSGQTITNGWNATYSPSSGQVTARNVSYNATIPANGSTTIGFQATHTGNTGQPPSFSLNGSSCSVG
jgi:endo-1,4-beta-xylanase